MRKKMKTKLTREIKIHPAFDKRDKDPLKNCGIHGCDLRFLLKGPKGVVQFVIFTNWQLPHVTEEFIQKPIKDRIDIKIRYLPMPADLGYHSLVPMYEGQTGRANCEYLDGKTCYYDGSSLSAEPIYDILLREGSDGVWKALEKYYKELFEKNDL